MRSEVYWIIAANVERLELLGPADLTGNGNTLNNTLVGNDGKNILRGGACNDTLNGGNTRLTHIMGRPAIAGRASWIRRLFPSSAVETGSGHLVKNCFAIVSTELNIKQAGI